jgi:hypothetical protein
VIRSKQHFEELTPIKRIVCINGMFVIWFEKFLHKISKGHGSNFGRS